MTTRMLLFSSLFALTSLSACNTAYSDDVAFDSKSPSASAVDTTSDVQSELRKSKKYRVTVQNVTAANMLSPPLTVVHTSSFQLFEIGATASAGVAQIAETGGTTLLEEELAKVNAVKLVTKAQGGPILPGTTRQIEFTVPGTVSAPWFNLISMIGRSNDSFVARPQSIDLSLADYGAVIVSLSNFDAGSEENTGNVEDFGPGGHPTAGAEGRVSYDRGLNMRGNAPENIGWGAVAAVVRIERLQ